MVRVIAQEIEMRRARPHTQDFTVEAKQRAQVMIELVLCFALTATSIAAMTIYIRRGLQARYRAAVSRSVKDITGSIKGAGTTAGEPQYEPYYTREAQISEEKSGFIEGGFPESGINMTTVSRGWRHTPLPERWRQE